jgi:Aspartyl/Asparaginyl beta-hydroxylase
MKWNGTCERIGNVDCSELSDWIMAIPFRDWPQQHKVDEQLRPAMVNDPDWHQFGRYAMAFMIANPLPPFLGGPKVKDTMLSVVMPGHRIEPHRDSLGDEWITRIHVPLVTNRETEFIIDGREYGMWVGGSYMVNISREHSVVNNGKTPRIHFMFDCYNI